MNVDLVKEYEILSHSFHGCSLAFYNFFMAFKCRYYAPGLSGLCWNDRILTNGSEYTYQDGRKTIEKLLMDFQREQIRWIRLDSTQDTMQKDPETLQKECQRRIIFFMNKIQELIGKGVNGKMDEYLHEMRCNARLSMLIQ
jgi:hypothetical protein